MTAAMSVARMHTVALFCIRHGNVQQQRRWMIRAAILRHGVHRGSHFIPIPAIMCSGFVGIEVVGLD